MYMQRLTLYKIREVVCNYFDIREEDIASSSRAHTCVNARMFIAYLLIDRKANIYCISNLLHRDRCTVIYYLKNRNAVLVFNRLQADFNNCNEKLKALGI